jgi:CRP-like cAMP-binding protein
MSNTVRHSLVKALRRVPEFADLDDRIVLDAVGCSANLFWPAGTVVFEPGQDAEGLYVVLSGSVRILEDDAEVARIGPGDYFGELSLLRETAHTKTARVEEDAELMVIPRESLRDLLSREPRLAAHLERKARERLPHAARTT